MSTENERVKHLFIEDHSMNHPWGTSYDEPERFYEIDYRVYELKNGKDTSDGIYYIANISDTVYPELAQVNITSDKSTRQLKREIDEFRMKYPDDKIVVHKFSGFVRDSEGDFLSTEQKIERSLERYKNDGRANMQIKPVNEGGKLNIGKNTYNQMKDLSQQANSPIKYRVVDYDKFYDTWLKISFSAFSDKDKIVIAYLEKDKAEIIEKLGQPEIDKSKEIALSKEDSDKSDNDVREKVIDVEHNPVWKKETRRMADYLAEIEEHKKKMQAEKKDAPQQTKETRHNSSDDREH